MKENTAIFSAVNERNLSWQQSNKKKSSSWLFHGFIILICWTFLALIFTPQTYIVNLRSPTPLTLWLAFIVNAVLFYTWALLTPFVILIGKRFLIEQPRLIRNLTICFCLSFVIAIIHLLLLTLMNNLILRLVIENYITPLPVIALVIGYGGTNIMTFWGIVAISQAIVFFRRSKEREISLAQAQLQAIQTQLHPHFLFNTMHAISELIHTNAKLAEKTVARLSDLLRISLQSNAAQVITLKEELDFLRQYIDVQQTLLQDRLEVKWNIAPQTLDAQIPNLLLQPLIENSIRHGIAPKIEGGTIEISSFVADNILTILVKDDGLGLASGGNMSIKGGIGLKSICARLQHFYGENHKFSMTELRPGQGLCVELAIPFISE